MDVFVFQLRKLQYYCVDFNSLQSSSIPSLLMAFVMDENLIS